MKSNYKILFSFALLLFCCSSFYNVYAQCSNPNLVAVCHKGNTICINISAVPAHLAHGDFLGPCDSIVTPTCDVDLGNDTSFCSNLGNLLLDAGPGFDTYLWSDSSTGQTLVVTVSGTYWVQVTDSSCVASDSINVIVFPSPVANAGNDTTITSPDCATLFASATGGTPPYSFLWSNADTAQSIIVCDTITTTYIVTVTDANGCISTDTVTVNVSGPPPPCDVDLGNDTSFCSNLGSLLLDAGPGFDTYLWSDSSTAQTLVVTASGTYWVQVTDSACVASDTINVTVFDSPVVNAGNDTTITPSDCVTLTASITGGTPPYSIIWSNGDTTQSILVCDTVTTTYIVMVTDSNGCMSTDTVTVNVSGEPPPCDVDLGNDTSFCSNLGSLLLDAGPGFDTYLWSDSSTAQTLLVTTSGTYWVQVTDSSCIASDTINVTVFDSPVVNAGNDTTITPPDCATLSAAITGGTPPYSIMWSNGDTTQTIVVCDTVTATYTVMVTDSNGCMSMDSVIVTVNPPAPPCSVDLGPDTAFCDFGDLLLDAGPGFDTYLWSDSSTAQTLLVFASGTYWVQVTDSSCIASDTINVTVFPSPTANAGNDTSIVAPDCATLFASATGGTPPYSFLWSNGDTAQVITVCDTVSNLYTLTVFDSNGCSSEDDVTVTVTPPCNIDLGPDTSFCEGEGSFVLDAGPGFISYLWSDSTTGQSLIIAESGTYWVQVVDSFTCVATDTINITVHPAPIANAGNDTTITEPDCADLFATVTGGTPPYSMLWSNGDTAQTINVCDTATTMYILTVTDSNGCTGTDTVMVTVIPLALINLDPNPNSERITFVASRSGFASLELYDMSGKMISVLFREYIEEDLPYRINFSGKDLPPGIYLVRLFTADGNIANSKMVLLK